MLNEKIINNDYFEITVANCFMIYLWQVIFWNYILVINNRAYKNMQLLSRIDCDNCEYDIV